MSLATSLQAQVDAQLMEQGAFAPLELLFNSGRLLYSDYESWRRREIELLDAVLMGNGAKIKAEIDAAVSYARSIGLVEQTQEFHAWHTDAPGATAGYSDSPLRSSADPHLRRLIGSRYIPAQNAPQLDLFFDNPVVALANGIVLALTTHNAPDAQRQLDRLYAQAPNHADLAAFDQLLSALGHLGRPVEAARAELDFLLEVTPTARRLLGAQSRDLLSPLWQQLAHNLGAAAFSPEQPALHRSFALGQAQDWTGVGESVLGEPGWQAHAPLCLRLVESALQRRRRTEALMAWCHLCWRAPELATQSLSKLRQPELTALWQRFLDSEPDFPPSRLLAEPALTGADFPAWLLLSEPGLAQQLTEGLPTGNTPAEDNYRCVHRWIHARRAQRQDEELSLRKTLQVTHPTLFTLLKQSV